MAFPNVSDIIATTLEHRSPEIADNVTNNIALLLKLSEKGNVRPFSGGRIIYEPLSFAENTNGDWYSGYDTLAVGAQDVISAAEYSIKQYSVAVPVSGLEMLQNSSKEQVIDLVAGRIKVAKATMKNDLEVGLFSDGTGSGGKQLVGLDSLVASSPSTGTVGGINRANYSFWRNQTQDPASTPTADTIQAEMTALWASCTRGNDSPDLIIAGGTVWTTFMASLQDIQRVTDSKMADAGFKAVSFMSAPVVLGGGIGGAASATTMYFLNTNYLHFRPHKDRNMVPLKKRESFNQDAEVTHLAWAGALTMSGAKFQGRGIFS